MRESVVAQLKTSDENAEPKISGRVIDGWFVESSNHRSPHST